MRAILFLAFAVAAAGSAAAQDTRLSPSGLGRIVDAVFDTLAKPTQSFSRVVLSRRLLAFDADRTIAAFQKVGVGPATPADLRMHTRVEPATAALLDDCKQAAQLPCAMLGWAVYATLAPVSMTDTGAVVRVTFLWADRGNQPFIWDNPPSNPSFLVGFTSMVRLKRDEKGQWRVIEVLSTAVG